MITCKYCGTELKPDKEKVELFDCSYCDMSFEIQETSKDRKRINPIPNLYDLNYYKSTKDLLEERPVILFHILAECRKDWYNNFSLMKKLKSLDPEEVNEELSSTIKSLYNEYIKITKQKFIIENILLEKAGFVPEKLTEEFLSSLLHQGQTIAAKPMYIYVKAQTKENMA